MSFISKLKEFALAHGLSFDSLMEHAIRMFGTPAPAQPITGRGRGRARVPHSNRRARLEAGLPHGSSGAKLIRRAAAGRIGI